MKIRKGKSNEKQAVDNESNRSSKKRSAGGISEKGSARNGECTKAQSPLQKAHKNAEINEHQNTISENNIALDIAKANSSTPRRRKDPLANLYSSLSPKYIGFSTPKSSSHSEKVTPTSNERGCLTRRKKLNNSSPNELFLGSTETLGYVRRTNNSMTSSPISTSDSEVTAHRRSFESPIEKLLRKNRTMDMNGNAQSPSCIFEHSFTKDKPKLIGRKELMDIKVKVARVESLEMLHKNGINTVQLDQDDKVINLKDAMTEEEEEEEEKEPKLLKDKNADLQITSTPSDNAKINITEYNETCDEICLLPLEAETEAEVDAVKDDHEMNRLETEDNIVISEADNSDENMNDIVESNLDNANKTLVEGQNLDQEEIMNTSTLINIADQILILDTTDESINGSEVGSDCGTASVAENLECVENENGDFQNIASESLSNLTQFGKDCLSCDTLEMQNILNPTNNTEISSINTDNTRIIDIKESAINNDDDEGSRNVDIEESTINNDGVECSLIKNNEDRTANNNHDEYSDVLVISENNSKNPNNDLVSSDVVSDRISESAEAVDEAENEENINNKQRGKQVDIEVNMPINIISVNSPSSVSMDSAKGSSVNNDVSWVSFSTGDIFWGQIYSYCYWPCMVCPDPDGKTITTDSGVGRNVVPHVMVHVRFFADNARRNWVKRDNLFPFTGLESYQRKMLECKEKYGKKNPKYKAFVVSKGKQRLWNLAIEEANLVRSTSPDNRLEKFNEIYENSKLLSKMEKKRRQSLYQAVGSTSDIGSLYDSSDNISLKQASNGSKRERSISPFSPAFSPVGPKTTKRRKLDETEETAIVLSSTTSEQKNNSIENISTVENHLCQSSSLISTSSQQDEEIFDSNEFKIFFKAMKEFVMKQNNDDKLERSLYVAVRNIWALKHINNRQMEARSLEISEGNKFGSHIVGSVGTSGSFKRLSNRLRNLNHNRSLTKVNTSEAMLPHSKLAVALTQDIQTEEKVKKPINRPIEEVIDDIFNLDNKYLFKGLGRDPICKYCHKPGGLLEKCSKNCQSMFHVECIEKSKVQKRNSRKGKSATNALDESSTDKNFTVHITADDVVNPELVSDPDKNNSEHNLNDITQQDKNNVEEDVTSPKIDVICQECSLDDETKCIVCKRKDFNHEEIVHCNLPHCLNSFHPSCCKYWPQAKITKSKNKIESFRCPSHVCHTCVSDDPKGKFQNISSSKLTKCIKCPASFHTDSTCIPAGSQILTAAYIICPRHSISKNDQKVNVNWCFICVGGGQVVCCETCPTAVHASCLNIPINSDEGYICEECETGRMPLYGEMVWAKFNNFRWWPAIILPPTEIPNNIMRMTHGLSDFVVRFFGTHDHGWISRRRVYLYLEGDSTEPPKSRTSLDNNYTRGVEEAKRIWEIIKSKKNVQRLTHENKQKLHPQPYVKIKSNRAVPPLKLHIDLEKVSKCDCSKDSEDPCGPESNCLNRVLYHECNPKLCPAGERCKNQMFESRVSPKLEVVYVKERGFGLICRESISAGTFVIEYVGEVINDDEFKQRMMQKTIDRDENFYFLSLEKDYIIDAGPKGNLARFMNHSCDPNCETQKWSVNGLNRVGLFAIIDIPADTELTFNYHWDELLGSEKKTCYCGTLKCAGQIGEKFKEIKIKSDSKPVKTKTKIKSAKSVKAKQLKRLRKNETSSEISNTFIKITSKSTLKKSKSVDSTSLNDSLGNSAVGAITED